MDDEQDSRGDTLPSRANVGSFVKGLGKRLRTLPDDTEYKIEDEVVHEPPEGFKKPAQNSPVVKTPVPNNPDNPVLNPAVSCTINNVPDEIKISEAKIRAAYRVKYSILRDEFTNMNIPEPLDSQTIPEIKIMYDEYVRRILIDNSVSQNKQYFMLFCLVIEYVGITYAGLPIKGYAVNQINNLNKYHMLLVELGEKSVGGNGSGYPAEMQILFMLVMQSLLFFIAQFVAGGNVSAVESIMSYFTSSGGGQEAVARAQMVNENNPEPPPVAAEKPSGGMGGIFEALAPMLGSFMGSMTGGNKPKPQEAPAPVRKPRGYASRKRE